MKIKESIPNSITLLNLLSGSIATLLIFEGLKLAAVAFIILGALFDFLDGFSARLLNVKSTIGKELDSLADLITFGMAPTLLLLFDYRALLDSNYQLYFSTTATLLLGYFPLIVVAASALRLAIFNVDERQHTSFLGLPTPANAIMICATVLTLSSTPSLYPLYSKWWFYPLLSIVLSSLLLSQIPMFSLKIERGGGSAKRVLILFAALLILVIAISLIFSRNLPLAIMNGMILYILFNVVLYLLKWFIK
ncbi:MAG: CDP-alcohol phosphatidyltransferase family protein [Bacteroidales bacterium]